MSYQKIISEDQRLVILQVLQQDASYSHNQHVIKRMLQATGHSISDDNVSTHLHWLQEQGLVSLDELAGTTVAKLTARGEDAATGAAQVPGVARPRPGA